MNALSPLSMLIAPAPAGRVAAGAGLVAPIETVAAPDGFAGWLPTTMASTAIPPMPANVATGTVSTSAPSTTAQGADGLATQMSSTRSMLANMSVALATSDPNPSAPAVARPIAAKPVGSVDTADLRLPMTSIALPLAESGAGRGFVPKTMPISGAATPALGAADVQPVTIAASKATTVAVPAEAPAPAAPADMPLPAANDPRLPADKTQGPSSPTTEATPVATKAPPKTVPALARALPGSGPAMVDPVATDAMAERQPDAAVTDPAAAAAPAVDRKARTAKPTEDGSGAASSPVPVPVPVQVDAIPPSPPSAPVGPPAFRAGVADGDSDGTDAGARAVASRSTPVVQAAARTVPVAGAANHPPAATVASAETSADHAAPTSEATPADPVGANEPATRDRLTGESRPATPPSSFRTQLDAVQQATKPAPAQPAPAQPAPAAVPVAQASHIGHDTAVAIARHVAQDGGESLTIRIAPAELGRIEVRLAFDDGGMLRATVAADQPASLDLLRRDTDSLVRALGDAGVRADSDSLRFDTRSDSGGATGGFASSGQSGGGGQGRRTPFSAGPYATLTAGDEPAAETRNLSPRGRVDLMA